MMPTAADIVDSVAGRRAATHRLPCAGLCLAAVLIAAAASQVCAEPLFLRIRPMEASPALGAGANGERDAEIARAARAAREAVWERSTARANIAIASVCTGCLGRVTAPTPLRPERSRPNTPPADAQPALDPGPPPDRAAEPPTHMSDP